MDHYVERMSPAAQSRDRYLVKSIIHSSQLLSAFHSPGEALPLKEICARCGLPKTMVFRLLYTLEKCGMYFAPFVQDDWKATSRLTLNLGLRWDYRSVPTEKDSKMFWVDTANTLGGLCYADQQLGTETVSSLGGPIAPSGNGFYRYCGRPNPAAGSKKPFAPRIGLAYRLGDKTVLRGGYGIFFDSFETREIDDSGDIYPFVVRANDTPTSDPTFPKVTDQMFPPVLLHQVSPAADGGQFFAVIISERPHNPYVQQWSFSAQRELARNTTLEANYVGNKGTHLLNRVNIGQGPPPANPTTC